jgi:supervillin
VEVVEGDETELTVLREVFNQNSASETSIRNSYLSFKSVTSPLAHSKPESPRLFMMTSLYGKFELVEMLNPLRSKNYAPYPFYQSQLYEAEKQPALFMFDTQSELYLWQGWFESSISLDEAKKASAVLLNDLNATEGSTRIRYTQNRKCAMQTAINYWNLKYAEDAEKRENFKGYVVYAGLEPIDFVNMFPFWSVNENARNSNLNDGKEIGQKDDICEMLTQLNRDCYPLAVLRQRPLPDGVNPLKLECYLSDQEFEVRNFEIRCFS